MFNFLSYWLNIINFTKSNLLMYLLNLAAFEDFLVTDSKFFLTTLIDINLPASYKLKVEVYRTLGRTGRKLIYLSGGE